MSFLSLKLAHIISLLRGARRECAGFGLIPIIFTIFFSAMMACGCVLAPPFQTPDEYAHFLRSVQISEGHLIGVKNGAQSGGMILQSAVSVTGLFGNLVFHPANKASIADISSFDTIGWGSPKVFADFRNTVIYGPVLYLPSTVAIFITRHLAWPVLQSYYMGRFANALAFLVLSLAALAIVRRGRMLFCFLLSLPMTVSLAMSVSQDGSLIAIGAVLAAFLTNHRSDDPWSWLEWGVIGLGFGLMGMAKPPYVALSGIACLLAVRRELLPSLICPLIAVILTFGWLKIGIAPVRVHFAPTAGVSETAQALFVAHHPVKFLHIVLFTISSQWTILTEEFTGVLGWLDLPLPQYYYDLTRKTIEWLLVGGFAMRLLAEVYRKNYGFVLRAGLILLLMLVSVLGIFLSLYLIWTVVQAPAIDGLQGRYFLPMTFFLAILLPNLRDTVWPTINVVTARWSALLCAGWMGLATFVFFQAILLRYWLP